MFTGPAARHDGTRHAVAHIKTAGAFACCIKAFDRFHILTKNLGIIIDRKTACKVMHAEYETYRMEGTGFDLFRQTFCRLVEIAIFLCVNERVVASNCLFKVGLIGQLRKFGKTIRCKRIVLDRKSTRLNSSHS